MPTGQASTIPTIDEGLLRQALALPPEQKLRLMQEVLHSELGASAEIQQEFLQALATTMTEARTTETPKATLNGKQRPHDHQAKALVAMEWMRQHRKEYGGQWVALDGDRLLAAGTDALEVYAAAKADTAYLSLIDYVEPADALPFIF